MTGGAPAAQVAVVNGRQVVVDQRRGVKHLKGAGGGHDHVGVQAEGAGGPPDHHTAQSLPAAQTMPHGSAQLPGVLGHARQVVQERRVYEPGLL